MSVIIISSDYLENGRAVAEKTAQSLGYQCLDRSILAEVAREHNLSEEQLVRALDEPPRWLGISSKARKQYLAYIQEATVVRLLADNMVCYGLGAHLYLRGVSHVLKVRIQSDREALASQLSARRQITLEKAGKVLDNEAKLRKRWSMAAFQLDETDSTLYDLIIKLRQIDVDRAVEILTESIGDRRFQPMTYSRNKMEDVALESRAKVVLLERFPNIRVQALHGRLIVQAMALKREKQKKAAAIKEVAGQIPGVGYVEVQVINDIFRQAIESFR